MESGRLRAIRLLALPLLLATIFAGVGSAASSSATSGTRPRTLVSTNHRIWAFALGSRRITWVSRAHLPGRRRGCGMFVQTLASGRTSLAPLPPGGCGWAIRVAGHGAPVLASGTAAWVDHSSCGNNECAWDIIDVTAGGRPRKVESVDVSCDFTCGGYRPRPALAGAGSLLVYAAGTGGAPAPRSERVKRIVGSHGVRLFDTGGDVQKLAVGGRAIEAISRVLDVGDGCGCLDSPAWSPDASAIAYLHGGFSDQQVDPLGPIAALSLMNADGSGQRDLTTAELLPADSLAWSPDGKQIAYVDGAGKIVVVSVDGFGSLQLASGYSPTWSPDGSKIAFAANGTAILSMNPDGSGIQQLAAFAGHNVSRHGMAWSPDGTHIAFSLDGILEVMNADGSNPHPLAVGTAGDEPAWSPDSGRIVFRSGSGLSIVNSEGSGLHQLTNGPDDHPSWSPDGKTIVFGSRRDDPYANSGELYDKAYPELYLVDANGSNLRPLSFTKPTAFENRTTLHSASSRLLPSLPGLPVLVGNVAAVGSVDGGFDRITLYSSATGKQLWHVTLGKSHGHFSVAGGNPHWLVFDRGRTISALDLRSLHVAGLTTAAATPMGLSVSGRTVAWAENVDGRGRIRALELPS